MVGRPRSQALDGALRSATAALLARVGYAATTVDAISALSGVPKSSLYRRWPSKAELVFATVVHSDNIEVPDTGRLGSDLAELSRRIVAALDNPAARLALPGLLADLADEPRLRQRFHDEVISAQRALVQLVVDRAVDRGELSAPVDGTGLHAQLLGTAYAWIMLIGGSTPSDLPQKLAATALTVLTRKETRCSTT